jgi:hypothetical protein
MHSKDFHDNVDIPPGFAFFDRMVDCRLSGCHSNRVNRHFHCTRPGCGYSFVRYSTMALHEKQHNEGMSLAEETMMQETKPRIHVKNPAELIDKLSDSLEEARSEQKDLELASPGDGISKTTGERDSAFALFLDYLQDYLHDLEMFDFYLLQVH